METSKIKELIVAAIPDAEVEVKGDGYHYEVLVLSPSFAGQSALQRQRTVYQAVMDNIQSGELHALSIKAKTHEEWQAQ